MKIKQINLKGWRSYSHDVGVSISDFKHINIIIGPNNSGKSNMFRYLFFLRELALGILKSKSSSLEQDEFQNYDALNHIIGSLQSGDTWGGLENEVTCTIEIEDIALQNGDALLHRDGRNSIFLKTSHAGGHCFSVSYDDNFVLLERGSSSPRIFDPTTNTYTEAVRGIGYPKDTVTYWQNFLESLVFVDPIRHYERASASERTSDFDGSSIINELLELHNDRTKSTDWRIFKRKIEEWLKLILKEEYFEIDATSTYIRFFVRRGEAEVAASLSDLGTGVSQLFMLLSHLFINRDKILNVFLEEPECNLHPEAVVQLVSILKENFNNHRFFISSHSSTLIDQIDNEWSINKVLRKGSSASTILPCKKIIEKYEILDELGVKASQLLQSNLVIWVEGPSDRIYIKKWISDHSMGDIFLEGKHYSFMFYGGSNLTSFDLMADDDFIDLLSVSRYSFIICDSDKGSKDASLKRRVTNLKTRLEELKATENGTEKNLVDYVKIHITAGREIENYIPHDLFLLVLTMDSFKRKYFEGTDGRNNINCSVSNVAHKIFGQFDAYDEFFTQLYSYEDGSNLNEVHAKNIKGWLSSIKTQIAKETVNQWDDKSYTEPLLSFIQDLVRHIRISNTI